MAPHVLGAQQGETLSYWPLAARGPEADCPTRRDFCCNCAGSVRSERAFSRLQPFVPIKALRVTPLIALHRLVCSPPRFRGGRGCAPCFHGVGVIALFSVHAHATEPGQSRDQKLRDARLQEIRRSMPYAGTSRFGRPPGTAFAFAPCPSRLAWGPAVLRL